MCECRLTALSYTPAPPAINKTLTSLVALIQKTNMNERSERVTEVRGRRGVVLTAIGTWLHLLFSCPKHRIVTYRSTLMVIPTNTGADVHFYQVLRAQTNKLSMRSSLVIRAAK